MILDGKKVSQKRRKILKEKVKDLNNRDAYPHLAIVQVGRKQDSNVYIKNKVKFGEDIGVDVSHHLFNEDISEEDLIKELENLNENKKVTGIIVQLPLPSSINSNNVIEKVSLEKDIDGLRKESPFKLVTTRGIITLLKEYNIEIKNKKVVVIGKSVFVGNPTAEAFEQLGAKVTSVDINTLNIPELTKSADIIISAVGKPNLIGKEYIGENKDQTIIDVGITVTPEGRVVGDIDFDAVKELVGAITPVPGGIGPMTVVSLFENLLEA